MAQIRNLSQTLSASKALSRGLKLHLWQLQFQHLQETEVKTFSQNKQEIKRARRETNLSGLDPKASFAAVFCLLAFPFWL